MDYSKLSNEDLKNIVSGGIRTEFWGWLKYKLEQTKELANQNLVRTKVESLDDCIKLSKHAAIYKTAEEILNFPNFVLGSIELVKKQQPIVKP